MGILQNEMLRAMLIAPCLILYGILGLTAADTIGQPIETMNTGLLFVSGLLAGLCAGMLLMVMTMPTREQFDERARELGYVLPEDKEKGA